MRVAVAFGVLATLALAYGAPHGIFPHTVEFVDQKLITERVKPVYGYRVRTSSAHEHPFAFGYKLKTAAPVVVHSEEAADVEGHSVGSAGFNYAFKTVAPVATPVAVGGVISTPVTFSSRKITERILGQESVEGGSSAADTVKVDAEQYLGVAPGPVAVTYEKTLHHAGSKAQGEGSFSYSYHADSPVVAAVPAAVLPASVAVVKTGDASEKSGSFAYSVTADAPVVAPAPIVAAAPIGVAVEHRLAGFGEKISHEKIPGSFSYSYNAEAPVLAAPVVHHSVVAAPVPVTSFVKTVDHVEDKGTHGSFSYSVTADAPLVGHTAAVVQAAQAVDTKSIDTQIDDKSSGSFSYSFNAEAPVAGAVIAPVVAAPVHTAYTTSVLKDEANIANRGSFSYSVTADAPVVAPVSYVASAPVGVSYEHTVVESGDKISDEKGSGAFAYSYNVDEPAVVAPVLHHSVVAAPAYTGAILKTVDHVEDTGSRGAFSYSVTADAPLVGHSAAVVEAAQVVDTKSIDTQAEDKSSGSFSYSFSAEAPIRSAVVAPVVAAPVHTAYTTSVVSDEAAIGNRGSFSYSVTADAPVVSPVSYVAAAPAGVEYEQTVVQYGDKISDDKSSGAFGYSYHVDAPAVVAPVVHHSVIAQPAEVVDTKSIDRQAEDKTSSSFSYSFSAEAPVAAAVVPAPVHTAYTTSIVKDEAAIGNRGSFSYSVSADAPVVAPVSYLAAAPVGVDYEQTLVHYGDKISHDKGSEAFGYSYHVDAPAAVAPFAHHAVVTQPLHTDAIVRTVEYSDAAAHGDAHVETKTMDASSEDKSSGSFSYSISAEAPVASVGAPVFHSSSVVGAVPVAVRGSVVKTDYINPISAVSLGVTADDLKLHSIGSFEGVYGVRTAPVETLVTGVQHAPIGYGVPITIKCD